MISGRDAVFPLALCWTYRGFVERGVSMQCILIPSVRRSAAIPEAALMPLVPQGAESRLKPGRVRRAES
jgi:hypothetical protein